MRIVVLVSGTGSNLQAVIDAVKSGALDVEIAAVGADRGDVRRGTLLRSRDSDICGRLQGLPKPRRVGCGPDRGVASFAPDVVVSSGFMRIVSADFIDASAANT